MEIDTKLGVILEGVPLASTAKHFSLEPLEVAGTMSSEDTVSLFLIQAPYITMPPP